MSDILISTLKETFEETGTQLQRIIDAYERVKPPYVPTKFPFGIKAFDSNNQLVCSCIVSGTFSNPQSTLIENVSLSQAETGTSYITESSFDVWFSTSSSSLTINHNFEIISTNGLYYEGIDHVEFVDPSTLPQS